LTFDELDFESRFAGVPGKQAVVFFGNGYGASVIQGQGTYGNAEGLYELAVIQGNEEDWDLCYNTEIADNVLGYLDEGEVTNLLKRIEEL